MEIVHKLRDTEPDEWEISQSEIIARNGNPEVLSRLKVRVLNYLLWSNSMTKNQTFLTGLLHIFTSLHTWGKVRSHIRESWYQQPLHHVVYRLVGGAARAQGKVARGAVAYRCGECLARIGNEEDVSAKGRELVWP